jgi:hypothetical protein
MRSYGQALDAAGCAGERREHQQEHQGEGELCSVRHWLQCSLLWIGLDLQSGKTTPAFLRVGTRIVETSELFSFRGSTARRGVPMA